MTSTTLRAVTKKWLPQIAILCLLIQPAIGQSQPSSLQQATDSQADENFAAAALQYKNWLATDGATGADKRHVKIKLPVIEEAALLGGGEDVNLYLKALDSRAKKDISQALISLEQLIQNHPDSRLRDDSLYLKGYILLMDNFDFSGSTQAMAALRAELPDSKYYDTALYSQAIAEEQQGNSSAAATLLGELKNRHTAFSIDLLGYAHPKDQITSRYWFNRSNQRLNIIEQAKKSAATIISKKKIDHPDYQWRMIVSADGNNHTLLLKPAALLNNTEISLPADVTSENQDFEVMAGIVEGVPDSWVRATIQGDTLSGTIATNGSHTPLLAAATAGSLGYYNRLLQSDRNGNTAKQHATALKPPTNSNAIDNYLYKIKNHKRKSKSRTPVTHVARLGVVIDSQYNDYHSGKGFNKAMSILNHTDGIFREEFGIALHIESVIVIADRKKDPMNVGYKPMDQILRNFRRYRMKTKKLGKDIGIATLFTGNKNSDLPLGLAWIGTACRNDGYDVSAVTPFRNTDLLSTHEIAHSLGAPHDAETACGESRYMMSRRLSSTTKQTFSACSIQSVKARLSAKSCHVKAADFRFE